MIIKIEVPDTTDAISVSAVYQNNGGFALTSRCFAVVGGEAKDANGSNKVLQED